MKKKAQMAMLIGIAILIISGFLILGLWKIFFSKANDASAEALCYGFNAIRLWGKDKEQQATGVHFKEIAPRTCRNIEKEVPGEDYPQTKQGAMAEISDMTARCWWMWLEGAERNMFRQILPGGKEPCFNCYSFNIKKGIDSFTGADLAQYMRETAYKVKDGSNNCAAVGGGFCADDCSKLSEGSQISAKEVSSNKCEKPKKCCISTKRNDKCSNKGGACIALGSSTCKEKSPEEYSIKYDGWKCAVKGESCCIKQEHFYSYFGYVQNYNDDGKGAVLYTPGTEFKAQEETYSISLISPDPNYGWDSLTKGAPVGGLIGAGGAAVGVCLIATSGLCTIPIALGIAGAGFIGGAVTGATYLTENKDINVVLISPLNAVSDKCVMELDIQ